MTYQALVLFVACAVPTWLFWVTPTPREWMLILAIGLFATVGGWFYTRALQLGEASALAPLDFVRLLVMTAIGLAIFGELPSPWAVAGGCVVLGAAIYTIRRNARQA
jgi:drug/metabolite transporter (DMT)-like permease